MLSEIQKAHDMVKIEMTPSPSKTQILHSLSDILTEAKKLTAEASALKKQNKHYKERLLVIGLENESLRKIVKVDL